MRGPRAHTVCVPDRKRSIDRDGPDDALALEIFDDVRAVFFVWCLRAVDTDDRDVFRTTRIDRAKIRHDVTAVVTAEREDVDDDDFADK